MSLLSLFGEASRSKPTQNQVVFDLIPPENDPPRARQYTHCIPRAIRRKAKQWVRSFYLRCFLLFLYTLDGAVWIGEICVTHKTQHHYQVAYWSTMAVLVMLGLDLIFRAIDKDIYPYIFRLTVWPEYVVFLLTLGLIGFLQTEADSRDSTPLLVLRGIRAFLSTSRQLWALPAATRVWVSGPRRRFQAQGFNLDLTYITDRILIMSTPADARTWPFLPYLYRNPVQEVFRFFDQHHRDHYLICNLCEPQPGGYPSQGFSNLKFYPIEDHNPAPLQGLLDTVRLLQAFLDADPMNVVCVHCDAGQGRSGMVVASLLLYTRLMQPAAKALQYVSSRRFRQLGRGSPPLVHHPSQRRYVDYVGKVVLKARQDLPPTPDKVLTAVRISGVTRLGRHWPGIYFRVFQSGKVLVYDLSTPSLQPHSVSPRKRKKMRGSLPTSPNKRGEGGSLSMAELLEASLLGDPLLSAGGSSRSSAHSAGRAQLPRSTKNSHASFASAPSSSSSSLPISPSSRTPITSPAKTPLGPRSHITSTSSSSSSCSSSSSFSSSSSSALSSPLKSAPLPDPKHSPHMHELSKLSIPSSSSSSSSSPTSSISATPRIPSPPSPSCSNHRHSFSFPPLPHHLPLPSTEMLLGIEHHPSDALRSDDIHVVCPRKGPLPFWQAVLPCGPASPAYATEYSSSQDRALYALPDGGAAFNGDLRFVFYLPGRRSPLFSFWVHTAFCRPGTLRLARSELDGAHEAGRAHAFSSPLFAVELEWASHPQT
eukprot:g56338.t1